MIVMNLSPKTDMNRHDGMEARTAAYRFLHSQWINLYHFLYIICGNSGVMSSIVTPLLQ